MESEVTRLRTRMAAQDTNEDLLTFLFRDGVEEISYVDDLKRRLT